MKLLRLKITDPKGFRSLQAGFEHCFRSEWVLQEEQGFAPFVCAGPNGSGKSNLLEALAAIFYHLECIYLVNLPDSFRYDENTNPEGFSGDKATPDGFEIEYLIRSPEASESIGLEGYAHVRIIKLPGKFPQWSLLNQDGQEDETVKFSPALARELLPDYILGYSSGENEILSLPFFKMRFIQFDEYWQALEKQLPYPGRPESRLVYLDSGFSQAILLCNLLFNDDKTIKTFQEDVKIEGLKEFRIILRRSIEVDEKQLSDFGSAYDSNGDVIEDTFRNHPALSVLDDEASTKRYRINLTHLLDSSETTDKIIPRLKNCATCWYQDEVDDTLYLDYHVNEATRKAFRDNFEFEINQSPITLFHAFQVLLTLNLFSASEGLKKDLYQSDSLYVSETVPILASDERLMRFKNFLVTKTDLDDPVLLKSFSDGEHQLLHTLGLCLLFKNTKSLFLLDEPETHFNPDWRANFVTRLLQIFEGSDNQEMLVTTHTPFLISDSKPENVLVFKKDNGMVSVSQPDYNTLGASINKITMNTFGKRETIGGHAQELMDDFRKRFELNTEDKETLINEIQKKLGDSVEKILLIKTILEKDQQGDEEGGS